MRALKLFLLQAEHVFEYRTRILVWFMEAFLNPLMMLLFWRGAIQKSGGTIGEFTLSSISTFYFLLIIANSLLVVHIEEDISLRDIKEGELTRYLLRPISYYWIKFNEEISYRLIQGLYGIIVFGAFLLLFPNLVSIVLSPTSIAVAIIISFLAYFISFSYKMCIGLLALWVIDTHGLFQMMEVIMLIFAGAVVPLSVMPPILNKIALLLPFSYIIYFPIIALQGKISNPEFFWVIGMQFFWIIFFVCLYKWLWRRGIYKFTAVGQ